MTRSALFIVVLLLGVGWLANALGLLVNALFILILLAVPVAGIGAIWRAVRGGLETRLWQTPFAVDLRAHRRQIAVRWVFWIVVGLTINACVIPAQFSAEDFRGIRFMLWGALAILLVLELLPAKRLFVATNVVFAVGSLFLGAQAALRFWPVSAGDATVLSAPFRGEWIAVQGGRGSLINHHYGITAQRFAVDFSRLVNGRISTGDGAYRDSFPSWKEVLYAPAEGTVVEVVNTLPDNPLKSTDRKNPVGNHITIDLGHERFVLLAHLQQGSATVAVGERVREGQPIAKCGNSGNTSEPHLHLQVQNRASFAAADLRTFPILFRDATCLRGDLARTDAPFFLRRNDRLVRN